MGIMADNFIDLLGRFTPGVIELYREISFHCEDLGVDFLVTGKTPGEFVRVYGLGLPKTDAAKAFDFTVTVASQKDYDLLKERLIGQGFQHNKKNGNWFVREYRSWCRIGLKIIGVSYQERRSNEKSFSSAPSASY